MNSIIGLVWELKNKKKELLTVDLTSFLSLLGLINAILVHPFSAALYGVRHKEKFRINNGGGQDFAVEARPFFWFCPNYKHTRKLSLHTRNACDFFFLFFLKGRRRTWPACVLVLSASTNLGIPFFKHK